MKFSFNSNNLIKLDKVEIKEGMKYGRILKKLKNTNMESLFKLVDSNNDGIVQKNEANLLKRLLSIADNSNAEGAIANNKNIEPEEIEQLNKYIDSNEIEEMTIGYQGTYNINTKYGQPENYSYIYDGKVVDVVYPENMDGEYFVYPKDSELIKTENGYIEKVCVVKREINAPQLDKPWSEGMDRNITNIQVGNFKGYGQASAANTAYKELVEIGKELGFTVEQTDDPWIEDYSIRRADGRQYFSASGDMDKKKREEIPRKVKNSSFVQKRAHISTLTQGSSLNRKPTGYKNVKYNILSASIMDGGNVLNTCKADGTPAAIIGEDCIASTLAVMNLEENEENIEIAKRQIAMDLGLEVENVTFIPQYDFHIDMCYRPLHNGEVAVPDYDAGIKMFSETEIASLSPEDKEEMLAQMRETQNNTDPIIQESIEKLEKAGYKVKKVPCFAIAAQSPINYMNAVVGTSSKTGEAFYITNKSPYPELDQKMTEYLQNDIGVDKVYTVSTTELLKTRGGLDCITQER